MQSTIVHWDSIRIMEKENGNFYGIPGLYRDKGIENGHYYNILGYWPKSEP